MPEFPRTVFVSNTTERAINWQLTLTVICDSRCKSLGFLNCQWIPRPLKKKKGQTEERVKKQVERKRRSQKKKLWLQVVQVGRYKERNIALTQRKALFGFAWQEVHSTPNICPWALQLMDGIHSGRIRKYQGRISELFRLTSQVNNLNAGQRGLALSKVDALGL